MKLVTINDYRPAALVEQGVIDLSTAVGDDVMKAPAQSRMAVLIERWDALKKVVSQAVATGSPTRNFQLLAPIPRPGKMLFCASNYREGLESYRPAPIDMFVKLPSTIINPGSAVILPPHDVQLFFHEAELGFVVGKTAKNVSEEEAMSYVFGYCCVNDVSSWGLHGSPGGMHNKNFDTFLCFGPCIVTADEIADPHRLDVKLWIDGDLRQSYNTSDMEHRIPALISWASSIATLEPGDLIACGTNHHGIGPIQDGEMMRLEISGIGEISNPVHDGRKRRWPKGPDRQFENWIRIFKETGKTDGAFFSVHPLD